LAKNKTATFDVLRIFGNSKGNKKVKAMVCSSLSFLVVCCIYFLPSHSPWT